MGKKIVLDSGSEYAKGLKKLEAERIEVHPTFLYTHQENRRAEQMNCRIKNCIWVLLI